MSSMSLRILLVGPALLLVTLICGCTTSSQQPLPAGWQGRSPNSPDTFRFVILSDRTGGHVPGDYEKAVAEVNLLKPDFVMCVGDLIEGYKPDEQVLTKQWQEFEDIISHLDAPFFYAPGNHDVRKDQPQDPDTSRNLYQRRHGALGKTYYSFNYRDCHFLILNTPTAEVDPAFAAEQKAFIEKDLANIHPAQHVFVFTHFPMPNNKTVWPTLKTLLPKDRSTIFTGHEHALSYAQLDGIPTYVLPSTGAATDNNPGNEHLYAQVVVDRGNPTIAFIPPGQIKSSAYAPAIVAARKILRDPQAIGVNAEGGEITLRPHNPGTTPLIFNYQFLAADWEISPSTAQLTIPPGQDGQTKFALKPLASSPTAPTFIQQCTISGFTTSKQNRIPVSIRATLDRLDHVDLDGLATEWSAVPAVELTSPNFVYENRDQWRGPMDSSCRLRAAIAGDRLAMLVEVADDQINTDQKESWDNDAVEICWDLNSSGPSGSGLTAGTGQLILVPADATGPAKQTLFAPAMQLGKPTPSTLQSFTRRTADGYTVEFSIPLAELGAGTAPGAAITEIKLAFCLDDRDVEGSHVVTKFISLTGAGNFQRSTAGYARFSTKPQ